MGCKIYIELVLLLGVTQGLIRPTAFVIYIKDYHIAVINDPTIPNLKCAFGMTSGGCITDLYCIVVFFKAFLIVAEICCRIWKYPGQRTVIVPNKAFEPPDYRGYHLVKISVASYHKFDVFFF